MTLIRIQTTDSTNRLLRSLTGHRDLEEGAVLVADEQTAGRGQQGTFWEAEAGKNITCSFLLYPAFLSLSRHFLLSEVVALGVKEAIDGLAPQHQPFSIKWPNDIYCGNRKIAGILIENDLMQQQITRSIVGVGLNVNQERFSSSAPNPVSLKQLTGRSIPLNIVLDKMLHHIMQWYQQLKDGQFESISTAYHKALFRKTGFYSYADRQGLFNARIESVSDDGFLHLASDSGDRRQYAFKEVAFVV